MWREHLRAYLDAAGGIAGDVVSDAATLPPPRATQPVVTRDYFLKVWITISCWRGPAHAIR
ncbi:MAG TPA: hypothetical protein VK912_18765 [Longimicrobiales bacterium]|nr:hypothetical protein [Longimicrobiales bacterium]